MLTDDNNTNVNSPADSAKPTPPADHDPDKHASPEEKEECPFC
jgi:hypothetical protein